MLQQKKTTKILLLFPCISFYLYQTMEQLSLFGGFENDSSEKKQVKPKAVPRKTSFVEEPAVASTPNNADDLAFDNPEESVSIVPDTTALTKVYYTITEVAAMFKVNASMLRFWEKEFPVQLGKVKKNKKGDRYYNVQDIEKVRLLYHLVKERRMTLEGAREFLKDNRKKVKDDIQFIENLQAIKSFLLELKTSING